MRSRHKEKTNPPRYTHVQACLQTSWLVDHISCAIRNPSSQAFELYLHTRKVSIKTSIHTLSFTLKLVNRTCKYKGIKLSVYMEALGRVRSTEIREKKFRFRDVHLTGKNESDDKFP